MNKAVIFDMDGLMVDSESLQSKAYELLLDEYGKKPLFNSNGLVQIVGYGHNSVMLKKKYDLKDEVNIIRKKRQELYQKVLKTENINSMLGLIDLLKLLKKNDFKIAVATSS